MRLNLYYNAPVPQEKSGIAAICVGINYSEKENEKPVLRFIVKRDLSIRIKSLTLVYRFSALPMGVKDDANPYYRFVCEKEDINDQEYIVLRSSYTVDEVPVGCTAVVSSVVLENGETAAYKSSAFREPEFPVVTSDTATMGSLLEEYFSYRNAEKQALEEADRDPVNSLTRKAAAVITAEEQPKRKKRRQKLIRRHTAETIAALLSVIVLVCGIVFIGSLRKTGEPSLSSEVAELIAAGRYGDAYKTVLDLEDEEGLQIVCRTASSHYLHAKDYRNAYLYASAAPEPFDREVIDVFISLLLTQNRQEEAYEFLIKMPGYDDAMQRVCASAVDLFIELEEYDRALYYGARAPESLENYVMQKASANIIVNGRINEAILNSLAKIEDEAKFDSMAAWAADLLRNNQAFNEAAVVASRIHDEEKRSSALETICILGMKAAMQNGKLDKAIAVYQSCSPAMKDEDIKESVRAMIDYSRSNGKTAGLLYFSNMLSENTTTVEITADEDSIRRYPVVWQYMTAIQKRSYHARTLALYKEAYRIMDGAVEGIKNAVSVTASEHLALVLLGDGSVKSLSGSGRNKELSLPADCDIVQAVVGRDHAVFLHNNGTVTGCGSNSNGQLDTSSWKNVWKIAAGGDFTAGLRTDGTVVTCGSNKSGQRETEGISGVIDIAACDNTLVLLMDDNTLVLLGEVSMGLKEADDFTDVRRLRAGGNCIIAENSRGSYMLAYGSRNASAGSVITWKNITEFAAGSVCIGSVDAEGAMKIEGDGACVVYH